MQYFFLTVGSNNNEYASLQFTAVMFVFIMLLYFIILFIMCRHTFYSIIRLVQNNLFIAWNVVSYMCKDAGTVCRYSMQGQYVTIKMIQWFAVNIHNRYPVD